MKKTLLFVCLFGSASLAFAEDTATKTEVYTQVGRLDERITETRSILDNRITNERKELDDRITGVDVRLNQTDKNLNDRINETDKNLNNRINDEVGRLDKISQKIAEH